MASPKQSVFHRSTSTSTLLLTKGLDCLDNTHTHNHCIFSFTLSHTLLDVQQFSHTILFHSHIHICLSDAFVSDRHRMLSNAVMGEQGVIRRVCAVFGWESTVGAISR